MLYDALTVQSSFPSRSGTQQPCLGHPLCQHRRLPALALDGIESERVIDSDMELPWSAGLHLLRRQRRKDGRGRSCSAEGNAGAGARGAGVPRL